LGVGDEHESAAEEVHSRPDDGRPCRCGQHHDVDDHELGAAIEATYDYEGAVLWSWHGPGAVEPLHGRAGPGARRPAGLSEREWRQRVRVAYAKVVEFQARGLVHFHAIVRLGWR
jgi:replication initiator protein RepSA